MSAYKYYEDQEDRAIRLGRPHIPAPVKDSIALTQPELTGGSSSYYKTHVDYPTTLPAPYDAECNDIIESLQMTFAEGNIFKAIWRMAASRLGNGKPGTTTQYDAEKVLFFAERLLTQNKEK